MRGKPCGHRRLFGDQKGVEPEDLMAAARRLMPPRHHRRKGGPLRWSIQTLVRPLKARYDRGRAQSAEAGYNASARGDSQPFSHTCVPIAVTTMRSLARVAAT